MSNSFKATIDFSAQFGGRDAAAAVLPHFRSLKAAAKTAALSDFPVRKLAYILRVDGEVNTYGEVGLGNVQRDGVDNISVDLVLTRALTQQPPSELARAIGDFLVSSKDVLRAEKRIDAMDIDWAELSMVLEGIRSAYNSTALETPSG